MIARLDGKTPIDQGLLNSLERQEPNVLIARGLVEAFARRQAAEDWRSRKEKQMIAVTLLRIGVKDDLYYQVLAAYATEALDSQIPLWYIFNADGGTTSKERSHEFLQWCRDHEKDPNEMAMVQLYGYMQDMRFLGEAEDSRAAGLLRRGLQSKNPAIVAGSVYGLAQLGDKSALPDILKACERAQPLLAHTMAESVVGYLSPEADVVLARFFKNPATRDGLRKMGIEIRGRKKETAARWGAFWTANPKVSTFRPLFREGTIGGRRVAHDTAQ